MRAVLLLAFIVNSIPAFTQESCTETAPDPAQELMDSINWAYCKEFGITDKSILKTPQKIDPLVLRYYRQKEYQLVDPIGDFSVTTGNLHAFGTITRKVLGKPLKNYGEKTFEKAKACAFVLFDLSEKESPVYVEKAPYTTTAKYQKERAMLEELLKGYSIEEKKRILDMHENGEIEIESKLSPVSPKAFTLNLIDIIAEEEKKGIKLSQGKSHKWSKEYHKAVGIQPDKRAFSLYSRVLSTLAPGRSAQLMVTSKEEELRNFILEQEDQSLTPEELFRKSYQINNGDMYLTLLTIENVLSEYWKNPRRANLKQTAKLKPIGKVFGSDGDVYGMWYHFFGIIYYGYVRGGLKAGAVGRTEGMGSQILSKFEEEYQENHLNVDGGEVGGLLQRYTKAKLRNKPFKIKDKRSSLQSSNDEISEELRNRVAERISQILKKSPSRPSEN